MNILVIDDEMATLRAVGSMLRTSGSTVDMAPSAAMAIRMMEKTPYDVFFVDYDMPTHNGVWFIRNAPIPPQSRVILLSGRLDAIAASEFRSLGVQSLIKKPFTLASILGCLKGIEDTASVTPGEVSTLRFLYAARAATALSSTVTSAPTSRMRISFNVPMGAPSG